jgi:carbon-monoxide dehydrogenase medium subunit
MSGFRYLEPSSIEEVTGLIAEGPEDRLMIAGGTALVPLIRTGYVQPSMIVGLRSLSHLRHIEAKEGYLAIGALVSHAAVAASPEVRTGWPLLARACSVVGTVRIRDQGTLGGNIVHADPNQDPPPALLALDASVLVHGSTGLRRIPVRELFLDYLQTSLQPDDVLTHVEIPEVAPRTRWSYLKFLPRSRDDYATISVALMVRPGGDGRLEDVRIAMGGVGSVPIRAWGAERAMIGVGATLAGIRDAAATLDAEIDPIEDARGPSDYKRAVARVCLERALGEVCGIPVP